uniref:Uncharacterized protein n=1 Tax=candidate division WWE3 bacterium TaxID=2053526 RepID=A0A831Z269_UNCKA
MTNKSLTLPEIQGELEEMFRYTSDLALGKNKDEKWLPEVRIAAAQASAQIAGVLMGISDFILAEDLFDSDGFDPDGFDHSPDGGGDLEGSDPSGGWAED